METRSKQRLGRFLQIGPAQYLTQLYNLEIEALGLPEHGV
jgi:hypothetical protein